MFNNSSGPSSNVYSTGTGGNYVSRSTAGGFDTAVLVSNGRALMFGLKAYNNSGSTRTVQVFDSAVLPTNGLAPKHILVVPAGGDAFMSFGHASFSAFTNGLAVASSSTPGSLTLTGMADCFFEIFWVNN